MIDWSDPEARARLIEEIGPDAYNLAFAEWCLSTVTATVNGYSIVPVNSRFGRLFHIVGTDVAFATQPEAEAHAAQLPHKDIP